MYSDKKSILELVALLIKHEINNIVVCPGSRNSPIVHTLVNHPFFTCYTVTDERSAAFFALGRALHGGKPAAVCCTSGTALLNMHPAVAEAYYQQVPLLVISADRPQAWIGQMDGQTLPQAGVFGSLVKKSVNLPEVNTDEDLWYCNRLINEAILELNHHGKGPVHINIPLSEPLFRFKTKELPEVRVITRYQGLNVYDRDYDDLIVRLNSYSKRLVIVGQMSLIYLFDKRYKHIYKNFAWFAEHLSNRTIPGQAIGNFDALLFALSPVQQETLQPELVITYGGHIVSKGLRKYLRTHPPKEHWHVSPDGEVVDLYASLTTVIEMDPFEFIEKISGLMDSKPTSYPVMWEQLSKIIPVPEIPYSEVSAIGTLFKALPPECVVHLGNSSAVRYAQLYPLSDTIEVCGNRGTAGIDGSLSTAIGYASASQKPNFILIGDLSFFYDMNALWMNHIGSNVRIFLLNNGGGEIFQTLPGLEMSSRTHQAVVGAHSTSAKGWALERGFTYLTANTQEELEEVIPMFTHLEQAERPMILEVFTDKEEGVKLYKDYFHNLRDKK